MHRGWIPGLVCLFAAAASADDLTGREALNATLWMQVAPEYRANVQQVYRQATERIAAPAPGSAARRTGGGAGRRAGASADGGDPRSRRDRARQHRVPGPAAARPRRLQPAELGRLGDGGRGRGAAGCARVHRHRAPPRPHGVLHHESRLQDSGGHRHRSVPGQDRDVAQSRRARRRSGAGSCAPAVAQRAPGMEHGNEDARGARSSPPTTASSRWWATISATSSIPKLFAGDRERLEPRFGVSWFVLPNPIYGSWTSALRHARREVCRARTSATPCWNCRAAGRGRAGTRCASRAGTSST